MPKLTEQTACSTCDLCGDPSEKDIHRTDECLYLCSDCSANMRRWADGKIGETVRRFLVGNVI